MKARSETFAAFFAAATLIFVAPAAAQTIIEGGTARQNVRTASGRAPGQMVTAGVARAQDAVRSPAGSPEITETADSTPGISERLAEEVITMLFGAVTRLLEGIVNAFLEAFGLAPVSLGDAAPPQNGTDDTPDDEEQPDETDEGDDGGEDTNGDASPSDPTADDAPDDTQPDDSSPADAADDATGMADPSDPSESTSDSTASEGSLRPPGRRPRGR